MPDRGRHLYPNRKPIQSQTSDSTLLEVQQHSEAAERPAAWIVMDGWNKAHARVAEHYLWRVVSMMLSQNGRSLYQDAWLLDLAMFLGPKWTQEHHQEAIGYPVFNA